MFFLFSWSVKAIETKLSLNIKGYGDETAVLRNADYGKYMNKVSKQLFLNKTDGKEHLTIDLDKSILIEFSPYFYIYLEPGDNLTINADVTKNMGGVLFTFSGKGADNNRILSDFMKIYFDGFPDPISNWNNKKLAATEVLSNYTKVVKELQLYLEKRRNEINVSLYHYLYTFTELSVPFELYHSVRNNKYDDKGLIYANSKPSLKNTELYVEGFFDINFGYYIERCLIYDLEREVSGYKEMAPAKQFDLLFNSCKSVVKNNLVKKYSLNRIIGYGMNRIFTKSIKEILPYIQEFQRLYPKDPLGAEMNKTYQLKLKLDNGNPIPEIDLVYEDGRKFSFADFKGKVIYIDFWASWCGPCRGEMKKGTPALHEKMKEKEVVFLYISIDEKREDWKKAIKEDKIEGIHLLDTKKQVDKIYGITGVPHYIVVDKDGKIFNNNAFRPSDPYAEQLLLDALSK